MASMALCHQKGKFLYEARPDLFPEGYLTNLELELWHDFIEDKNKQRNE